MTSSMSVLLLGAAALLFTACPVFARGGGQPYNSVQYLKNYALSACIASGYKDKRVVDDALAAANGYKELGSLPIEAYNEAGLLGDQFLSKKYHSRTGSQLILMKCIDFYHSGKLDELAHKYSKESGWPDNSVRSAQ